MGREGMEPLPYQNGPEWMGSGAGNGEGGNFHSMEVVKGIGMPKSEREARCTNGS